MSRSKRGRPFTYTDPLMGSVARIRQMIGRGVRVTEEITGGMPYRGVRGWPKPTADGTRSGRIIVSDKQGPL